MRLAPRRARFADQFGICYFLFAIMNEPQTSKSVTGLVETALYLDDVGEGVRFYQGLFGFPLLSGDTERDAIFAALEVPGQGVLLLFKKGATAQPFDTGRGIIPPHGGAGRLHLAFAIPTDSYGSWKTTLGGRNIKIESEVHWPRGGRSLYFRDPAGNLVELATPGLWAFQSPEAPDNSK
jgi:catechol 2,3-dioxygenase-like lactoylglutathione lyase family enzyme